MHLFNLVGVKLQLYLFHPVDIVHQLNTDDLLQWNSAFKRFKVLFAIHQNQNLIPTQTKSKVHFGIFTGPHLRFVFLPIRHGVVLVALENLEMTLLVKTHPKMVGDSRSKAKVN
uniref:(northern house mosquito) hypothetical protein n=1 Tax=Culex pipiens TaxID=7175 RepID=A0A8D8H9W3_CULPI